MKLTFILLVLSTGLVYADTPPALPPVMWAIYGPLTTTETVTSVMNSTAAVSNVILRSPTTPDCYQLEVTPNGSLTTEWVSCPEN